MKKPCSNLSKYIKLILKTGKLGIIISFLFTMVVTSVSIILPEIIRRIIDTGIASKKPNEIILLCSVYMILVIASNGISMVIDNYCLTLNLKTSTNLKLQLIDKLSQSNGKYLSNQETGNILRILDNDLFQIESFGPDFVIHLIMNVLTAMIVFIIMLRYNIILLLTILTVQLLMFVVQSVIAKHVTVNIKKAREIAGDQSNLQEQFISNIKNAILTNVVKYFQIIFYQKQNDLVEQSKKVNLLISFHSKFANTFTSLSSILTYLIGGIMIILNKMSLGELIAFLQYTSLLIAPCMFLVNSNIKIKQVKVSLDKIYTEIERIDVVTEKDDCLELADPIKEVHFFNVHFSYLDKQVLHNLNCRLSRNKVTAIVGESGCGKSTLLNLLYRLWDPDSGDILINGISIKNYNLSSLRDKICVISQEALIFNDNIEENIKMNNQQIDDNFMELICHKVGVTDLIKLAQESGNNSIGERGSKLSGGQKQRIAIARALIKQCDVLIFDESTSALDNISQKELLDNITPYFKNKIVVIIAHRLSSIKYADNIVVMKDGTVIESGDHKTLMDQQGVYYRMTNLA